MERLRQIEWKGLEGNTWKYTVHAITNKRTYMTFLTIFLLTMPDATAKTIGLLTLVGQIVGFLVEVPSGYISDRIGHKKALIIARSAMALSTLMYIFADNVYWFFAGAVLLAIGWAFVSGTGSAFMHNTLQNLGKHEQYADIMGRIKSIGFAIPVLIIILLAFIAEVDFRVAFIAVFIFDLIGLAAVFILEEPRHDKHHVEEVGVSDFKSVFWNFFKLPWLPFVIAGVLFSGLLLGATIGFKNPYQEFLGFSISTIGILWALSRAIISVMLYYNGKIHELFSFKQFLIFESVIVGVAFLGIGLTVQPWVVAFFFILTNVPLFGFTSAREQYYLAFIGNSKSQATLLSMRELLNKVVIGVIGVLMGLLVHNVGFQNGYLMIGFSFVLLITGIMLFVPHIENVKTHERKE